MDGTSKLTVNRLQGTVVGRVAALDVLFEEGSGHLGGYLELWMDV